MFYNHTLKFQSFCSFSFFFFFSLFNKFDFTSHFVMCVKLFECVLAGKCVSCVMKINVTGFFFFVQGEKKLWGEIKSSICFIIQDWDSAVRKYLWCLTNKSFSVPLLRCLSVLFISPAYYELSQNISDCVMWNTWKQ